MGFRSLEVIHSGKRWECLLWKPLIHVVNIKHTFHTVTYIHTLRPLSGYREGRFAFGTCWLFWPSEASVFLLCSCRGTSFLPVDGCQHVQHPLVCNLTETFSNRDVTYTAKVTARLEGWNSSSPTLNDFKPIRDSKWLRAEHTGEGFTLNWTCCLHPPVCCLSKYVIKEPVQLPTRTLLFQHRLQLD